MVGIPLVAYGVFSFKVSYLSRRIFPHSFCNLPETRDAMCGCPGRGPPLNVDRGEQTSVFLAFTKTFPYIKPQGRLCIWGKSFIDKAISIHYDDNEEDDSDDDDDHHADDQEEKQEQEDEEEEEEEVNDPRDSRCGLLP